MVKKIKMMKSQFLCVIGGFLNVWCFFVCGKLPFGGFFTAMLEKRYNKAAACSHHLSPLERTPSLDIGISGYTFRIYDPGPSNLTIFLGHCFLGDDSQSRPSNNRRSHLQLYRKGA